MEIINCKIDAKSRFYVFEFGIEIVLSGKNKSQAMNIKKILGLGAMSLTLMACSTNPVTGRRSLQLVSNEQIDGMALQQYRQTLQQSKVVSGTSAANSVKNVGLRIKNAANNYYRSVGRQDVIANYQWEFNLIDDKQMNAWCMPGGKVAVYTGILPITQNDKGLAVVMGHEVSHALAGHGNERISQAMMAQLGGQVLGSTISNGTWANVFSQVYPVGAQVALLKYGRSQELEADEMGLYLMAMAGYDPRESLPFWQRMEASSNGNRPPEFLSTHPNPNNRRADLQKHMAKALQYYQTAGGKM